MSALFQTNLVVVAAPLPADFEGNPQEFFEALVERLSIQSPVGTNFFVVGDVEPSTNQGPWLKNGNKWYVFDEDLAVYVPIDISDSLPQFYVVSDSEPSAPGDGDASIWLRTVGTRVIAWYFWSGTAWRPGGNVPASGPTASRPTSPVDLEQYWDTDIDCLIHWERGAWRTVSGTPGDVKFVTTANYEDAIEANPGWQYVAENHQSWRGRVIGIATKNPGGSPTTAYSTDSAITSRAQADETGTETHVLASGEIESHTHLIGKATALNSNNDVYFMRVDDGKTLTVPNPKPANYFEVKGEGSPNGTKTGEMPAPAAGTAFVTSRQLTISESDFTTAASAHQNMQPTLFLWCLVKT